MDTTTNICFICLKSFNRNEEVVILTEKGCSGIIKASNLRSETLALQSGQEVHTKCRKNYCAPHNIKSASKENSEISEAAITRKKSSSFIYKSHCIFCGKGDKYCGKKLLHKLLNVKTTEFSQSVRKICNERNDEWAGKVRGRMEYINVYHNICSVNFRTNKNMPQIFFDEIDATPKMSRKRGRPIDEQQADAYEQLVTYISLNKDQQYTINSLLEKLTELQPNDSDPYSATFKKKKLLNTFKDDIVCSQISEKQDVLTFHETAFSIIHKFFTKSEDNPEEQKKNIIISAARLIKNDIIDVIQSLDYYTTLEPEDFLSESLSFIPESLRNFLKTLFSGRNTEKKVASLGQALMQAARPRSLIAPLQIGLDVQLNHHYASKFLIDTLSAHGFCSSYYEVQKFEKNACVVNEFQTNTISSNMHIQYIADNIDHNTRTLDGFNTFHGIGIIASITSQSKISGKVPRNVVLNSDIEGVGRIDIKEFSINWSGINSLVYEKLDFLPYTPYSNLEFLHDITLQSTLSRPLWSGMMQLVMKGEHSGLSSFLFLPMIDLDPGNPSCLYFTLHFVCKHAKSYNRTPILTFDQPLYWKALAILKSSNVSNEIKNVVLRLGGFHTLMSFLGVIEHLMEGSGLQETFCTTYAEHTVRHMMTGKAYARSVRGHMLVSQVLNFIICQRALVLEDVSDEKQKFRQHHKMSRDLGSVIKWWNQHS